MYLVKGDVDWLDHARQMAEYSEADGQTSARLLILVT
jgi:hypothetical protein